MRWTWCAVWVVASAAFAAGCDDGSIGDLDLDALPELSTPTLIRIGSRDDPDMGFSRVGSVDVDRDGSMYVLESSVSEIRVYAFNGFPVRRFGGRGEGPGEFQRPPRFGVVGDTVWAFDSGASRITLFTRDGTLLSTGRVELPGIPLWNRCYGHLFPQEMRADGRFSTSMSMISCNSREPAPEVGDEDPIRVARLLLDASGSVVDTLGWDDRPPPQMVPVPGEESTGPFTVEFGGTRYMVPQPPTTRASWLQFDEGRIEVDARPPSSPDGVLAVRRIDLSGDTVWSHEYHYEASGYAAAELDSLAESAAESSPFGGGDPAAAPRIRAAMSFPDYRPATSRAFLDDDRRIWLRRDEPASRTSHWVVLDTDGSPLGTLELPGRAEFKWSSGAYLIVVEPDGVDVPWLVRYDIVGL